eukprot:m.182252 g.182252  ORF g.182252 m.182252 type:complete len:337 (+) comp9997_c0_seq3:141-1151(+)
MIASLKQYSGRRPLKSYGVLVRDGDLTYRCDGLKVPLKLRYVFLFNLGLICCKAKGPVYHFKAAIDLDADEYEIQELPSTDSPKENEGKHSFYFSLVCRKGSQEITHIFAAKSLAAKKKWVSEIQLQLQSLKDVRSAPPETLPRGALDGRPLSQSSRASRLSDSSPRGSLPPIPPSPISPAAKAAQPKSYEQWVIGAGPPSMPPPPLPPTPAAAPLANSDEAWYAGRMPRNKADELLESSPPGTYLVRESDSRPGDYSLSVAFSIVKHIKISRRGIKYEIAPDSKSFASIQVSPTCLACPSRLCVLPCWIVVQSVSISPRYTHNPSALYSVATCSV